MHPKALCSLSLALLSMFAHPTLAQEETSPVAVVDTMEKNFGVPIGQRRNHTKGVCVEGSFTATRDASKLSRSPIFSGKTIPVVGRFSIAGGRPNIPDTTRNPRGMALRFMLPDGSNHMMAMLHTPVFSVATPAAFLESLQAASPDPATGKPNPEKQNAFAANHPETKNQGNFLKSNNPPASYASTPYYSLHAFRFINAANEGRYVRWHFDPQDGTHFIEDAALAGMPTDFLESVLKERMSKGAVKWDMYVTLAEPGDTLINPTIAWPKERKQVRMGTLALTRSSPQTGGLCEQINFNPMVMTDGVEASDDPVLHFRSPAYAVSFGRRLSDQVSK
ncbi:MAG: catalase family peroxidase [Betaproteobacteria bacterium]